jgi:predicted AAA+ superfamily ATPase
MSIEALKQKIQSRAFWESSTEKSLLPDRNMTRSSYLSKLARLQDVNVVTSLMGQRRCGKSVIGRQYIKKLWDDGIPRQNVLYINFFLKPIADVREEKNFISIVEWWTEQLVDREQPSLLVLDEVQELENWDENVASIFEDASMPCRLIITGSNSKMLSDDFSAKLGGRYTTLQVFPFSFAEFCQFTETGYATNNVEKYLLAGGMPEVLKVHDEEQRMQLISDIINSTVKHDIVSRYNPSNPGLLYALIDFCRTSFSQELSIKSISNAVLQSIKLPRGNQAGTQTTSSLVRTYIDYMQDVYFLYSPPTYSHRAKEILKRSVDKMYLGDLSLSDYKAQTQKGRLLENMVYIELLRNNFKIQRYLGYRNKNLEIDFYVEKSSKSALIQVCWQLGDSNENRALWEREFGNLYYTNKDVPKFVVSLDDKIDSPYRDVEHLNIMQFLAWAGE